MNRIKQLRKEKMLTISELSDKLGIPKTTLNNYENGNRTPRDQETWETMAQYFGVPVAYLMGIENTEQPSQDIENNIGDWILFAEKTWGDSEESFLKLFNSTLAHSSTPATISKEDLHALKNGEKKPSDGIFATVAHLINVDYKTFRQGNILRRYNELQIETFLKKSGILVKDKKYALTNLVAALNEVPIIQFGYPEIMQMYSHNLLYKDNQIYDKHSILNYLKERRNSLLEAEQSESIPDEIKMDIAIESASITEDLIRQEIFEEIFRN